MKGSSRRPGIRLLLAAAAIPATGLPAFTAAQACSVFRPEEPSPAQKRREARVLIAGATVIIDGEVVRPWKEGQPALVRAVRVLKGPTQEFFQVGMETSCDIALEQKGERARMILYGGPEIYFMTADQSNFRYEDRLLGSDRRKVWPYRAGEED